MRNLLENVIPRKTDTIIGKKCGTITVSVYKEESSGSHIFHIQSDNEEVLPVSYVIEDVLSVY